MLSLLVPAFAAAALAVLVYMLAWYVVSMFIRRADVADIAWGLGFVLALAAAILGTGGFAADRALLLFALVAVWGLRLSWHVFSRNRRKPEDARYRAWRESWGKTFWWRSLLQIFALQGALLLMVVSPAIVVAAARGGAFGWLDAAGVLVWLVGFTFESVGDAQLRAYLRQDPAARPPVMSSGLWRYTRHPNYFGEVTQWWGIWLVALSVPGGWIGILGPLTISFLILKVSGIPMLERAFAGNPAFEEYKKKTSAFFPLPPRA
jgi:steroid 5-alpha reductase family enzyme